MHLLKPVLGSGKQVLHGMFIHSGTFPSNRRIRVLSDKDSAISGAWSLRFTPPPTPSTGHPWQFPPRNGCVGHSRQITIHIADFFLVRFKGYNSGVDRGREKKM